jgi:hypothetical protein
VQRRGRGNCRKRRYRCRATVGERRGRRPVRNLLRRQDRETLWIELQRLDAEGLAIEYLKSQGVEHINPIGGGIHRHSQCRCGMGRVARQFRHAAFLRDPHARDLLSTEWISAGREKRALLAREEFDAAARLQRDVSAQRRCSEGGR